MKRALVVFDMSIDNSCSAATLRAFMEAVLHVDNFGLTVSRIWERSGQPPVSLISEFRHDSKLKRVRILP